MDKKRGKGGFILYEGFELLFAAAVILLVFGFVYRAGTGIDFEKVYVANDIALTLNALYGVAGDVRLDYENPYMVKFTEEVKNSKVYVYDESIEKGVFYPFVQSKSSILNAKFIKPNYLLFTRLSGNIGISQTRMSLEKAACPDFNTKADIKKAKIIIDPGHSEQEKGFTENGFEEYKITKQIADSTKLLCKSKGYDCYILQQGDLKNRLMQIKDITPNEADLILVVSVHLGSDPLKKESNPLKIYAPSGYIRSEKLACLIKNKFVGNFDSVDIEKINLNALSDADPLLALNPWKELPDVFPAVQVEVGNIYNKGYFQNANNIALISSSIIYGIEEYYK
ncbi:MAG: N-acetylmuramoyl-L-alanine amidase [Candidatus Woesearchaeota archaeon]|nr:N-acetylmuramoyl-L-alanine amidase [Candidatus Woesearchaeota archaeon]